MLTVIMFIYILFMFSISYAYIWSCGYGIYYATLTFVI